MFAAATNRPSHPAAKVSAQLDAPAAAVFGYCARGSPSPFTTIDASRVAKRLRKAGTTRIPGRIACAFVVGMQFVDLGRDQFALYVCLATFRTPVLAVSFRTMTTVTVAENSRFEALWHRCTHCPPSSEASVVASQLRGLLGAPYRHFHNLDHIRDCLHHLDAVVPLLDDPDAVELALWFHDAIYDPGDPANERRSAELFLQHSTGATPVMRRRVCGLILATRHWCISRTSDRRFIEDIDLAGFGAPWDVFMHQGDLLRREFASQDDVEYYNGQVAFLEQLARRPILFATDYYRACYEARARTNLQRLLDLRRSEGYGAASRT